MSCDLIIIDGWICEQVSTGGMLELCMRQCLESIYPNYPDHQRWLERQARDVLLCRFSGDWLRMKHEFLEPAAELIGRLHHICHQSRFHVSFNSLWFFVWNNRPFFSIDPKYSRKFYLIRSIRFKMKSILFNFDNELTHLQVSIYHRLLSTWSVEWTSLFIKEVVRPIRQVSALCWLVERPMTSVLFDSRWKQVHLLSCVFDIIFFFYKIGGKVNLFLTV